MSDEEVEQAPLSVDELVEYCRIQAGLLSGHVETMTAEAADLLDEIDEEIARLRERLDDHPSGVETTASPPSTSGPGDRDEAVEALGDVESELGRKQSLVEAKQARIAAFQDLAGGYAELADELESEADDGFDALERVVRFEHDNDAPVYFDDRRTLYESVGSSDADQG